MKDSSELIWKVIEGFNSKYEISNKGAVRRKLGENKYRMLKLSMQSDGYLRVLLSEPGHRPKLCAVHRLVASYFIPNPENKRYVAFKDHNATNVSDTNLMWLTYQELIVFNEGVVDYSKKNKIRRPRPVLCTTTNTLYPNISTASRCLNISPANISLCIKENRSTRDGLRFKLVDNNNIDDVSKSTT